MLKDVSQLTNINTTVFIIVSSVIIQETRLSKVKTFTIIKITFYKELILRGTSRSEKIQYSFTNRQKHTDKQNETQYKNVFIFHVLIC